MVDNDDKPIPLQVLPKKPGRLVNRRFEAFLKILAETNNVTKAAESVGRTRSAMMKLRHKYPQVRDAWDSAIEQYIDKLESAAFDRAINGSTYEAVTKSGEVVEVRGKPSDLLAKFLLTAYRHKEQKEVHEHRHLHLVKMSDAELEAIAAQGKLGKSGEK